MFDSEKHCASSTVDIAGISMAHFVTAWLSLWREDVHNLANGVS